MCFLCNFSFISCLNALCKEGSNVCSEMEPSLSPLLGDKMLPCGHALLYLQLSITRGMRNGSFMVSP